MSHIINKIFGRDDEAHAHHSSIKTETHTSAKNGGEGINIKSTISSDINSSVSMANQQKLNDLVTKLGSTHTQIDEYAKKQTAKINDEIQREIDQVLACTRIRQEELLKRANEHTNQIDAEYCAQLQRMVEEIDAAKAKRIAEIETELNGQQGEILQTARREIDQLNQKAANLKIGVLQEAQAQAASQADQITTQATNLGQATTAHNATGTTTIKTEVTAAATTKETGNAAATTAAHCSNRDGTCADGSCSKTTATHKEQCSAGGAKTLSETRTSETARHQSNTSKN